MARVHRFLALATVLLVSYFLVLYRLVSIPFVDQKVTDKIVPVVCNVVSASSTSQLNIVLQLPWTLLVAAGSYSLASLGWGLLNFRDCPEAYEELMKVRVYTLPLNAHADCRI